MSLMKAVRTGGRAVDWVLTPAWDEMADEAERLMVTP